MPCCKSLQPPQLSPWLHGEGNRDEHRQAQTNNSLGCLRNHDLPQHLHPGAAQPRGHLPPTLRSTPASEIFTKAQGPEYLKREARASLPDAGGGVILSQTSTQQGLSKTVGAGSTRVGGRRG